jgi:hypothetical protein
VTIKEYEDELSRLRDIVREREEKIIFLSDQWRLASLEIARLTNKIIDLSTQIRRRRAA